MAADLPRIEVTEEHEHEHEHEHENSAQKVPWSAITRIVQRKIILLERCHFDYLVEMR
jgi:hypothetical protein